MPLIYRKTVHQTLTTMAKIPTEYKKYLHPSRALRPGDREVPLKDISDRQLAELAARYPDEYGQHAAARNIAPADLTPRSKVNAELADEDESKPVVAPARAGRPDLQPRRGRGTPAAPTAPTNRGAKVPAAAEGDDELDDLEDEGVQKSAEAMGELETMFVKMTVPEAIGLITEAAAQGRTKVLVKLLGAEEGSPRPRKSVLKAFVEVGVKQRPPGVAPAGESGDADGEGLPLDGDGE